MGSTMPILIQSRIDLPFGQLDITQEEHSALTLEDAPKVFPAAKSLGRNSDPVEAAYQLCETLRSRCPLQGSHEHLFMLLYFDRVIEKLKFGSMRRSSLLPLPKARFSLASDQNAITADFAFWTGHRFVTVFIRESGLDRSWSVEERLLKLWGFEVFRLMADQLETQGLNGETGSKILDALWLW